MERSDTDKRIDDLAGQVRGFEGRVDHKFERLEDKIDARFGKWDKYVIGGVVSIVVAVVYKILGL